MSVSKVQRSKDATASVIYAVWGTQSAMKGGKVRAAAVSVVGPHGSDPLAWAMETRELVRRSVQRQNETINVIQSFSPDELNPNSHTDVEKAHAAGLALAARVAPDCDVTVATHADTAHVHNHIIIANHDRGTGRAAPKDVGNAWRVRVLNDEVMKSFGLEVLEQDPVSYSREERLAQVQGRDIDGAGLELTELTKETWREFARARIEDLMEDDRVLAALDIDGVSGVEPALDMMENIASDYHLSFSRKGRGKRRGERSSFALVDDKGKELRVTGPNGTGSSTAATAGSRLGADYTMDGLRARLHELHAQRLIDEMELEDNGGECTTYEDGQQGAFDPVSLGGEGTEAVGRRGEGYTAWDFRGPDRAVEVLSAATSSLKHANGVLEAFNRGDSGVREGDGASDVLNEINGRNSRRAAGCDSAPARWATECSERDGSSADLHGRVVGDGTRTGRRTIESQRRRNQEIERQRREALESNGPEAGRDDVEPCF